MKSFRISYFVFIFSLNLSANSFAKAVESLMDYYETIYTTAIIASSVAAYLKWTKKRQTEPSIPNARDPVYDVSKHGAPNPDWAFGK
jgi:hypothetical protein